MLAAEGSLVVGESFSIIRAETWTQNSERSAAEAFVAMQAYSCLSLWGEVASGRFLTARLILTPTLPGPLLLLIL